MSSRSIRENRQLNQRKEGIMKKAKDLEILCGIKVAIFFQDKFNEEDTDIFRTEEGFPASINIQNAREFRPIDVMTGREAKDRIEQERWSTPSSELGIEVKSTSPLPFPNLDSSLYTEPESVTIEPESFANDISELQWEDLAQNQEEQPSGTYHSNDTKRNAYGNSKLNFSRPAIRIQKAQVGGARDQALKRRMLARQRVMLGMQKGLLNK